jgi:hypothetical protein
VELCSHFSISLYDMHRDNFVFTLAMQSVAQRITFREGKLHDIPRIILQEMRKTMM